LNVEFKSEVKFPDTLTVRLYMGRLTRKFMVIEYVIDSQSQAKRVGEASTKLFVYDYAESRMASMEPAIMDKLKP